MKKIITTASILFFSQAVLSDEINCIGYSGFNKPSSIEKLAGDCALQKNLASDESVQNEHRKKVYDKLADRLAVQIKQNSEDISLLTSFFNSNGQDLMMNSSEIAQSCRLDSIKKIETCNGKKTGAFQDVKLAMLKSKLPKNSNTPFKGDQSLFGIMAGKFYSDLGMKEKGNELQCPLEGQAGNIMIKAQLDEASAKNIIERLSVSSDTRTLLESYPQLKIIKNADDKELFNKFISFVKNKPANKSAKNYIASFFFDPEYQKKLAPTLARQCSTMNENINRFLCSDITELGSLDDTASKNLFNKLNTTESMEDQYEVDFNDSSVLTAYGMQCIAKENRMKNPNIEKDKNFQSIDQWYANFTNNTRAEDSGEIATGRVQAFCSMYTCTDPAAKKEKSCQKGGPLTSADFSHSFGCDLKPLGDKCLEDKLKSIAYMQGLEKLKQDSKDQLATSKSSTSSSSVSSSGDSSNEAGQDKVVSGKLPNFAENYLGVEGSLKALGKPVTAYEISEKKQEFTENKLASNEPIYSTPAAIKTETPKQQKAQVMASMPDTSNTQPTFTPTAMTQTTAVRPTFASPAANTETAAIAAKPTAQKLSVAETSSESSRLREEMEKMIADIKSTKEEITGVQNNLANPSNSLGKSSGSYAGATPVINRAEHERLRRLEQSLNEKSDRLEEYRKELDNRNFAQSGFGSEGGSGRSPGSSGASHGGSGGGGGGMNAADSSGSGNSLKLTSTTNAKGDGKASGSNYSAALIQSGVESSTITVDELSNLSPENLKKLGIDSSLPFTLKVTFDGQTYQVPVKSFIFKGAKILGPIMDPKNKELNDFLLKSPLFKQYIEYRIEKDLQAKASF